MVELFNSFISKVFLRSVWGLEYGAYQDSEQEKAFDERLRRWSTRKDLRETSAEAAFIEEFFPDTWGYEQAGQIGLKVRCGSNPAGRSPPPKWLESALCS
jgi:hypothetical protein